MFAVTRTKKAEPILVDPAFEVSMVDGAKTNRNQYYIDLTVGQARPEASLCLMAVAVPSQEDGRHTKPRGLSIIRGQGAPTGGLIRWIDGSEAHPTERGIRQLPEGQYIGDSYLHIKANSGSRAGWIYSVTYENQR